MTTEVPAPTPMIPSSRLLARRPIWAGRRHKGTRLKWKENAYDFWIAKTRPIVYRIPRSRARGDAYYALAWEDAFTAGVVTVENAWFPRSAYTPCGAMAQDEEGNIGILQQPLTADSTTVLIEWPCTSYKAYKARTDSHSVFSPRLLGPLTAIALKSLATL